MQKHRRYTPGLILAMLLSAAAISPAQAQDPSGQGTGPGVTTTFSHGSSTTSLSPSLNQSGGGTGPGVTTTSNQGRTTSQPPVLNQEAPVRTTGPEVRGVQILPRTGDGFVEVGQLNSWPLAASLVTAGALGLAVLLRRNRLEKR